MFRRSQWIVMTALMIALPLAVGSARAKEPTHTPALQAKKKLVKPGAKAAKPGAKAASRLHPHPGSRKVMITHRPLSPPPTARHNAYDVPQAKSLAATPDVVLNSRVRASLMAALTAAKVEDIEPTTVNHVVTLTGSVHSKELRARAEQVAHQVRGVRAVRNELAVK